MKRSYLPGRHAFLSIPVFAIFFVGFATSVFSQNADLGIVKSGPATVAAGTDVTYNLSVNNGSSEDSTPNNVLSDTLPAGMTFVSEDHDPAWTCSTPPVGMAGTITCTDTSAIPQEGAFVFTFVFHLDAGATGTVSNTATISHAGSDPNSTNDSSTATATIGIPPPPPLTAHDVLISEFRLSGPGGNLDQYVELYCNRDGNCDISGMSLRTYDSNLGGDFAASFPSGSVIPARQYLLLISDGGQYSLIGYALPDFTVSDPDRPDFFSDNEGIQLIGADEPIVIDSVGFIGGGNADQYIEGAGLERATAARPADQYAYVRKRGTENDGLPQDTNNNANDFVLVSVTGATHPGISAPPALGAPGPQGLTSPPSYSNSQVTGSLVEPSADIHATPNRVRTGSGNSGTLSIRRSFTNNTSEAFDYISFRVTTDTTLNSPNIFGGEQSDLRLVTSADAETFENSQTRTVLIRGTILEFDPGCGCEPAQPNGGGLNSTVHANLPQGFLIGPGETVDVQFLLNVVQAGSYRFYVYVEAFPAAVADAPGSATRHTGLVPASARTTAPRKMINVRRSPSGVKPTGKKPKHTSAFLMKNGSVPIAAPQRTWIFVRMPTTSERNHRRKVRVRRKASAALRAKIETKYDDGEKTSQK